MAIEDELRQRLRKVEALLFGATTAGEREAANAAAERLKAKLAEASRLDPPVEMKFTMPDQWSARLFIALCRRYGFRPFRYARQRSTTIMVKAPRRTCTPFWGRPHVQEVTWSTMSKEENGEIVEVARSQLQEWLEEIRELRRFASKHNPA